MQSIRLREKARLERESWNPESAESEVVWHFSIPNFDDGAAKAEEVATIKSGKTLITKPCVLVAKLNPKTPRVWLIEHLKPGVNVCSTEFLVLSPRDTHDLRYLYFVLKSPSVVSRLAAVASGSSTSHQRVRPAEVEALEVEWEESSSRRQWVADFLWEIEEKIRANNDTSRTLEELAATFFKSWFIDFDPVKAKMAGETPDGMDAETAALFPNSTEESELGEIPSGWSVTSLGDFSPFSYGKSLPAASRLDGGIQVFGSNGPVGTHSEALVDGPLVVVGRKGTVGTVELSLDPAWPIDTTFFVRAQDNDDIFFIFELWRSLPLAEMNSDAAVPGLNRDNAHRLLFAKPDRALLDKFAETTGPFYALSHALKAQNVTLAAIRDSLLPRLVSGELEIPDEMLAA